MFTGIIEEIGRVESAQPSPGKLILSIAGPKTAALMHIGSSVSVNGICLTAIAVSKDTFQVEAVEETLQKSGLRQQATRGAVNLELPLRANDRFGGHIVLGHVDATGSVEAIHRRSDSWLFTISHPENLSKYIIQTGSVSVDGVSLTIANDTPGQFTVSIIPHTMANTIFQFYKEGDIVNIEADVLGKYVEKMLFAQTQTSRVKGQTGLSVADLRDAGF